MIKIVTDSSSYFEKDEASAHSIIVVPINYTVNGMTCYESYSDQNGDFETVLKSNAKLMTSQPNINDFLSVFEEEQALNNEVLCITLSSHLSGTYSTAFMAAKQIENDNIAVFDSQLAAGGLYLLVLEAKKLINNGKTLQEILKMLPQIRDKISIAFSVDDMTPLHNSGRIGLLKMKVGTILNIKPILRCCDGAIAFDSIARGHEEIIKKLAKKIPENVKEIVVNYIEYTSMVSNLYDAVRNKYPNIQIKLQKMGPVLGIHLGVKVVAVSYIAE